MNRIGDISSVITLISFILYLIGRLWIVKKNKKIRYEDFKVKNYDGSEAFYVISNEPINWYKIYEIKYDEDLNIKKNFGKLKCKQKNIRQGDLIKVDLPCGMAHEIFIFERFDYMRGKILLQNPGRDGVIRTHGDMKHTWKSILFYLVK